MSIITFTRKPAPRPAPLADDSAVAIAAAEAGTAILSFERDLADNIDVTSIERLPAGIDPAARWLADRFPDLPYVGTARVVIDADGLGQALWTRLHVNRARGWTLFDKRGRDRQELVNALLVAQSEGRVTIRPSRHEDAMRRALLGYRRVVGEDGVVGAELVVALALAAHDRRPPKARAW